MPGFLDRLQARALRGETRDEDIELPMPRGGKRDPRLPPDVPGALRKALEGGKQFNAAVEGLKKRAK